MQSAAYARIVKKIAEGRTVILDGGIGSEIERLGFPTDRNTGALWGTRALYEAPDIVKAVHQGYVAAGADIITTDTWQLGSMPAAEKAGLVDGSHGDWRDQAQLAVALARGAANEAAKALHCAVAFSLSTRCLGMPFLGELLGVLKDSPPDVFLVETLTTIPEDLRFPAFEALAATGVPVWLAYRRCLEGVCDVHGVMLQQDQELFERAIPVLEDVGVKAILINCLPPRLIEGMLPRIREETQLPLGVYPNIGRFLNPGWRFDQEWDPASFASEATRWRDEQHAQIIGGCCGVTAEHIAAAAEALST